MVIRNDTNMRHIILFLFTGILLGLSSCDLKKVPLAALSPDTYFSNEQELKLYSNQFYSNNLPSASGIWDDNSDAIIITPLSDAVTGQRIVPATGGGWSWTALRRMNYMLANNRANNESVKNEYDGLAKFFRAFFYFEKLKRFGEVPWFSEVIGSDDRVLLFKPRDTRDVVIDSIMSDLDFAITYLGTSRDVYRVNKWTALALKSRAALFEGTFRKYHDLADYEKYLTLSAQASEELISNGGYSLYKSGSAPYRDLFANTNAYGTEVILARDYDDALGLVHDVQNFENASTKGRPGLSKSFVNMYLTSSGSRFTGISGYETVEFFDETKNRDPRLAQTIRTPGYTRLNNAVKVAPNLAYSTTGYHLIKYDMGTQYDQNNKSISDIPVFRIAEAYLNFAEAKAELGTLTQGDLDKSVNLLRSRVGMPAMNLADANANPDPYLSSAETGYPNVGGENKGGILEIRRERGIELIMEGFRYYDVMRWKVGKLFEKPFLGMYFSRLGDFDLDGDGKIDVCLYEGTKPASAASLFLKIGDDIVLSEGNKGNILVHGNISRTFREDRDYLYPIPTEEIQLSENTLHQNPNWE